MYLKTNLTDFQHQMIQSFKNSIYFCAVGHFSTQGSQEKTSPQAKRHKFSLLFTSLTIFTSVTIFTSFLLTTFKYKELLSELTNQLSTLKLLNLWVVWQTISNNLLVLEIIAHHNVHQTSPTGLPGLDKNRISALNEGQLLLCYCKDVLYCKENRRGNKQIWLPVWNRP